MGDRFRNGRGKGKRFRLSSMFTISLLCAIAFAAIGTWMIFTMTELFSK